MSAKNRIGWIDTMKVVGMYFIVLGHMFPIGYESIYAFSVPLFFILSGLVSNRKVDRKLTVLDVCGGGMKLLRTLIIPMLVFCTIELMFMLIRYHGTEVLKLKDLFGWFINIMSGNWGGVSRLYPGLNICWFLYSLVIIRLVFIIAPVNILYILVPVAIGLSVFWHGEGMCFANAWADAVVAYPFFVLGFWSKRYIEVFEKWNPKVGTRIFMWAILLSLLIIIPRFNSWPEMYINGYGENYFLFVIGAISGTILVFDASKMIGNRCNEIIAVMACGNILTLGLHMMFIRALKFANVLIPDLEFVEAIGIMVIMYPIILLCKKYVPFVMGLSKS